MTAEELERLKELVSLIPKEHWQAVGILGHLEIMHGGRPIAGVYFDGDGRNIENCHKHGTALRIHELIAALRNAAPALIALAEWAERARSSLILIRVTAFHEACVRESADQLLAAYPEGE